MSLLDRVRFLIPLSILLVVSVFVLFYKLEAAPLGDWDEGIYAVIAAEMVESGDYFHMTLMGESWMEKPLLPFWLEALSFKMFGFTEMAARFFPALAAIGSVLLLYGLGRRLFSWYVGFWSAFLFAVSPLFLDYHMARSGDHDVMFLFWFLLALYAFVRSWKKKDHSWWLISGIAAGFAIFTRGALGFFAVLIPLLSHIFFVAKSRVRADKLDNRYSWQRWLAWAFSWILIGGSWHLFAYLTYGQQFIDVYITEQFFSRISGPLQGHAGPWWFYAQYLWETVPFVTVAAVLMTLLWLGRYMIAFVKPKKISRIRFTPQIMLLLVWVGLLGFSTAFMSTKLPWYILGAGPALFIIAASAFKHPGAPRAFATIGVAALLVFYGFQLPHRATAPESSVKQAAESLRSQAVGEQLVVYNTAQWNFGRILPSTYWYLKHQGGVDPLSVDRDNLEYYLDRDEYKFWLTNTQALDDFKQYTLLESFGQKEFGDLRLLIRQ